MHLYPKGGHSFELPREKAPLEDWSQLLFNWILELN